MGTPSHWEMSQVGILRRKKMKIFLIFLQQCDSKSNNLNKHQAQGLSLQLSNGWLEVLELVA